MYYCAAETFFISYGFNNVHFCTRYQSLAWIFDQYSFVHDRVHFEVFELTFPMWKTVLGLWNRWLLEVLTSLFDALWFNFIHAVPKIFWLYKFMLCLLLIIFPNIHYFWNRFVLYNYSHYAHKKVIVLLFLELIGLRLYIMLKNNF